MGESAGEPHRSLRNHLQKSTIVVCEKPKEINPIKLNFYLTNKCFDSTRIYTTQNLLRITFSFNDLMLKTNRLKKDFFYKDRLILGLDDPVANMSIRHVYDA